MKLNRKDVEHVAQLSRLELSEKDLDKYTGQLDAILEYIDVLSQVDTSGVEPMAHVLDIRNVMRPDVVQPSLSQEAALQNAPEPEAASSQCRKSWNSGGKRDGPF